MTTIIVVVVLVVASITEPILMQILLHVLPACAEANWRGAASAQCWRHQPAAYRSRRFDGMPVEVCRDYVAGVGLCQGFRISRQ